MSGRQVEKSTTASTHMANYTLIYPYFNGLYFAPLTSQVDTFSKERIGRLYEYSVDDVVKKEYRKGNQTDNVYYKTFSNGSVNYFKHCFEYGDNIRGISVNGVFGDEIQDIHVDALPVIRETQSHACESGAGFKVTWYMGTPKTFSNTIQQQWDKSTQAEWVVKCPHCGTYQILGVKNITPKEYICRKCKMDIPKICVSNGMWRELQPGKKLKGFRISQLMVPWITSSEIYDKMGSYSQGKFYNEVLGRSFEDSEKPFSSQILGRISANDYSFYPRAEREFANTQNFMGVDWGTGERSYTVVSIFSFNSDGQFQMIFTKRYDHGDELEVDYQVKEIAFMMQSYHIKKAIVDWGFGVPQYQRLRKMFGDRVSACYYSFNAAADHKYREKDGTWIVNRTKAIGDYITAVKEMRVIWPGNSKAKYMWMFDHHLSETAEYRKSQNGKSEDLFYNHPEGQPDDGMHSCVYAWLASKLKGATQNVQFASAYGQNI